MPRVVSVGQLRQGRTQMHGDVIGLAALDLVLWRLGARMVGMAFVVDVAAMDPDDRVTDAAGL